MSVRNQCVEEAALVEYLYDDSSAEQAAMIAAHVATCATCADEVRALQATREELQAWTPPDVALGFQVVPVRSAPAEVRRPASWWRQPLPAWAQVAAAVALFSAGAVLGALRAVDAGFSQRPGAARATAPCRTRRQARRCPGHSRVTSG
jgi:anti-sigma factor RsiW